MGRAELENWWLAANGLCLHPKKKVQLLALVLGHVSSTELEVRWVQYPDFGTFMISDLDPFRSLNSRVGRPCQPRTSSSPAEFCVSYPRPTTATSSTYQLLQGMVSMALVLSIVR